MSYSLSILRRAQKEMAQLPATVYDRVRDAIRGLSIQPRPPGSRKLTGREGWRIRVGDYRIIYEIDDSLRQVTVLDIGNRRDIYR